MPYWRLRECSSGSEPPTTSPFDAYSVKLGKWPHWTSPFGMRGRTPRLMCTALKWGGTVNRPLFMTVYSHRTRSHVGCNTLPHFFTRPGGSTRPAAPTQRNQLKPLTPLFLRREPTADLVLSSPEWGTTPSGYGSAVIRIPPRSYFPVPRQMVR